MAIQIAIGGDLEVYSSGADWAKVRCTNGAAPDWTTQVETDGDGFATLSGVVTSPHEQGFIIRWNASPSDYRLVVITHGGGDGLVYGNNSPTTGRTATNGGVDWPNLQSSHKCRIVDIKWFDSGTGQGWFSRPSAAAITWNDCDARVVQVMEWIHANLNQRNTPLALIGSSGGANAVLAPLTLDSAILKPRIHYVCPASYPQVFWDTHNMCHVTTPAGTYVDKDSGELSNDSGDVGVVLSGNARTDYALTTTKCTLGTVTVGELAGFHDEDNLDGLTPWYQGTLHVTVGQFNGVDGGDVFNGVIWAAGNLKAHAFWQHARVKWFSSVTDSHGAALDTIQSQGFAQVHAELAALADGAGGLAMAAYNKFQDFVEQLLLAKHDFSAAGHVFKVYASNAAPSASLDAVKADLAEITAANGYPAGGTDIQNSVSEAAGTVTVAAVDVVWTASGGSFGPLQFIAAYNDTQTSPADPLVAWWDYGSALTINDGETLTIDFGSNTLFTLV